MKQLSICIIALLATGLNAYADYNSDGTGTAPTPVVFNLGPKAQTASPNQDVYGFRLNGFYGENKNVYGADLGFAVNNTKETFGGIELAGLVNITGKDAYILGFQAAGLANVNRGGAKIFGLHIAALYNAINGDGRIVGGQFALVNMVGKTDIVGLQVGLYNKARTVTGLQIGVLNFADSLHGIQIGALNFSNHGLLGVFPVFNFGF